jgi:hypothetical protein
VRLEDRATFTGRRLLRPDVHGHVTQIRKGPGSCRMFVTYTVVVAVDNPGGRLLPA